MKERTEAFLKAMGSPALLAGQAGTCGAVFIATNRSGRHVAWYYDMFADEQYHMTYWIGPLDLDHVGLRLTFLAMAAAVSETEE